MSRARAMLAGRLMVLAALVLPLDGRTAAIHMSQRSVGQQRLPGASGSGAEDLVRFGLLHVKALAPGQRAILSHRTIDAMQQRVAPSPFGMGWFVFDGDAGIRVSNRARINARGGAWAGAGRSARSPGRSGQRLFVPLGPGARQPSDVRDPASRTSRTLRNLPRPRGISLSGRVRHAFHAFHGYLE